jgi:hypothetical protein
MMNVLQGLFGQRQPTATELNALTGAQSKNPAGMAANANPTNLPGTINTDLKNSGLFSRMGGMEGVGDILDGIGDVTSIYTSLKALGLAKDQVGLQREAFETNTRNQTQSYNTALSDRAIARGHTQGDSRATTQSYIDKNRL